MNCGCGSETTWTFDRKGDKRLNIGLYIHIPFCQGKCPYCGFYSETITGHNPERMIAAIEREFILREVETLSLRSLYVGGGTPSCLPISLLGRLMGFIGERTALPGEVSIEANPDQVSERWIDAIQGMGFNRLSLGVQSLDDTELALLGRRYSAEQVDKAIAAARGGGMRNLNLDLIFALPGQGLSQWQKTMERAVAYGPEHLSCYSLSYEPGSVFAAQRARGELVAADEELEREMYLDTIRRLTEAELGQYELSNFCRAGYACVHNLGYWDNRPYLGLGPAAGSYYQQRRWVNQADIGGYLAAIEAGGSGADEVIELTREDIACETAVLNLRRQRGIHLGEYRCQTGYELQELFADEIAELAGQGLVIVDEGHVRLSEEALPIADQVLAAFASV